MTFFEKLQKAKKLIIEVELELIQEKKFCPYEIGYTLKKLDEAINQLKDDN
ncbi:MAG: hypothetical protein V2B14_07120 [bacterium]